MRKLKTIDLTLASTFVALMAIGANITSIIPFMVVGGVPITRQTFFGILAGLILGSRLGTITTTVYAFVGLVGVPGFAQFSGGVGALIILYIRLYSFIYPCCIRYRKIVEKFKSVSGFIIAALIGTAINYIVGTNWMYYAYRLWGRCSRWIHLFDGMDVDDGATPKDIILAVVAGLFAHRLEKTVISTERFKHLKIGA